MSGRNGHYESAQVCLNGHPIASRIESAPQFMQKHCGECGEATITTCPSCNAKIRGKYMSPGVIDTRSYLPPKFCHECGKPFPWTDRRITAAKEFAQELDNLSEQDKKVVNDNIGELAKDSPQTPVAAERMKKVMANLGKGAGDVFRGIVTDVASETAKKILFPGS